MDLNNKIATQHEFIMIGNGFMSKCKKLQAHIQYTTVLYEATCSYNLIIVTPTSLAFNRGYYK